VDYTIAVKDIRIGCVPQWKELPQHTAAAAAADVAPVASLSLHAGVPAVRLCRRSDTAVADTLVLFCHCTGFCKEVWHPGVFTPPRVVAAVAWLLTCVRCADS
jgi:hypothetical protein